MLQTTFNRCFWTWHNSFKSNRAHISRFLNKRGQLTWCTHISASTRKNKKIKKYCFPMQFIHRKLGLSVLNYIQSLRLDVAQWFQINSGPYLSFSWKKRPAYMVYPYFGIDEKKYKNQKILLSYAIDSQKTRSFCFKLYSIVAFVRGTMVSSLFEPISLVFLTKKASLHGVPIFLHGREEMQKSKNIAFLCN